jgi:hypothetical protein
MPVRHARPAKVRAGEPAAGSTESVHFRLCGSCSGDRRKTAEFLRSETLRYNYCLRAAGTDIALDVCEGPEPRRGANGVAGCSAPGKIPPISIAGSLEGFKPNTAATCSAPSGPEIARGMPTFSVGFTHGY